ncbi:MAG TPA: BrnT family toxin [Thermoanaerobaculia bacterium]|nr:BrnT family toxin [Thermoanaerobaculia bacterium]
MGFEWDSEKAASIFKKHRIHFADAIAVFDDDFARTIPDEEQRFVTLGIDALHEVNDAPRIRFFQRKARGGGRTGSGQGPYHHSAR